jgi:hypothetical protein
MPGHREAAAGGELEKGNGVSEPVVETMEAGAEFMGARDGSDWEVGWAGVEVNE